MRVPPPAMLDDVAKMLHVAQDRFIAAWGQMGTAWGISRTMAEVQALLYIVGEPLCTDDIMDRLQISRGNASMSLRALMDWGIVTRTHKRGDRKEYFQTENDVWALFRSIVRERLKREVDPLLVSLFEIRDLTQLPPTGVDSLSAGDNPNSSVARSLQPPSPGQDQADKTHALALAAHNARLDAMLEFFQTVEQLGQSFVSPSGRGLQVAADVLSKAM